MQEIISKYINKKAVLGQLDCLSLMLEALGQHDVLNATRGRYSTMTGARRVLPKIVNQPSPYAFLCSVATSIQPTFAQTGDVVILDNDHFGLIVGHQILMADSNNIFRIHQWAYLQNCPVFRRKE